LENAWISVKDKFPERGQKVDWWVDNGEGGYRIAGIKFICGLPDFTPFNVTHWMPLTTPPE
jgi:hypothetical protein